MAIQSVTSNVSTAYTATPNSQTSQTQQAQQVQQAEGRESRVVEKPAQQESPQPVTNVQGQRTGTLINVTA
jgi:hypothetical protein